MVEPGLADGALHLPLRGEVRDCVLRSLVEAERAREHEPPRARLLRGRDDVPRALRHHALEVGGTAADDRDEVDDRGHSLAGSAEGSRIGHVPGNQLGAPRCEARGPGRLPHERPHRRPTRAQRVHDVRPDEPRPAGDEGGRALTHASSKFCQ